MRGNSFLGFNRRYATNGFLGMTCPWVQTHGYLQTPLRGEEKFQELK
jgi:hypothetical protein